MAVSSSAVVDLAKNVAGLPAASSGHRLMQWPASAFINFEAGYNHANSYAGCPHVLRTALGSGSLSCGAAMQGLVRMIGFTFSPCATVRGQLASPRQMAQLISRMM